MIHQHMEVQQGPCSNHSISKYTPSLSSALGNIKTPKQSDKWPDWIAIPMVNWSIKVPLDQSENIDGGIQR